MIINQATLTGVYTGFKAHFQAALDQAPSHRATVATVVPSSTREEEYGWLGKVPGMREWLGDRVVHGVASHGYKVKNRDFELTIGVDRNDIEDDRLGVYAPLFQEMGMSVAAHPEILVFDLLKAGFTTPCYDGQYFFDTDHPVLNAAGVPVSVANTDGGSGTPWYLICGNRALKPIIFQERKKPQFVRKDRPDDDNVFDRKEYVYGVDSRCNVGYGLWQLAWGSKQTLNAANYQAARAALQGMKGDYGKALGLMPTTLVVPPALEGTGLEILNAERDAAGATNVWRGTAKLEVVPWLA
ncbi:MAG: Mu-like prophage major head subunit gpT family protein [Thalassobaculales bacterium]